MSAIDGSVVARMVGKTLVNVILRLQMHRAAHRRPVRRRGYAEDVSAPQFHAGGLAPRLASQSVNELEPADRLRRDLPWCRRAAAAHKSARINSERTL